MVADTFGIIEPVTLPNPFGLVAFEGSYFC